MAIAMDSLIINRTLSGTMIDRASGKCRFSIDQLTEASLECTGETVYVNDATGVKVAAFDRSKEATLSGSNAFINLGLAAAQFGAEKKTASSGSKIIVPKREILTVGSSTVELTATPEAAEIFSVSVMTKDGGIGETLTKDETASEGKYQLATKTITVDTASVPDGTRLCVLYKTSSESGIQFDNRADMFSKGGEFWLEVLFADPCDTNTEYHGFVVFPNAKMTNETTINFSNEATHDFTIEAIQDYCDPDKRLFYIVVSA